MAEHAGEKAHTCTCTDPAVVCPSCLARRDRNGWPKDWRERMRGEDCGSNAADWCLADNDVECTRHDQNGNRRG